jgi:cytochrome b6-f complex iron-sulfur subunit
MSCERHNRREFCVSACQTLTAATLGLVLPACSSPTAPDAAISLPNQGAILVNNTVVVNIDPASPLAAPGRAALVQTPSDSYLVARTGANAFSAVTAVCTHFGCIISRYDNQIYVCPCHGSQFNASGAVVRGPASRPLRQFATEFTNNTLTIRL